MSYKILHVTKSPLKIGEDSLWYTKLKKLL